MADQTTTRIREGMANELVGYLRYHGEDEAAELIKEYAEKNA